MCRRTCWTTCASACGAPAGPTRSEEKGWDYGTPPRTLRSLVEYWADGFDWRAQEARLNRFAQFRTEVDGLGVHFVHERGHGPAPMPLLLPHGWTDSFWRFVKIVPLLTHPKDPDDAFDVVVPSLPGYGFSDAPKEGGWDPKRTGKLLVRLMESLGYDRFGAQGGDWGSIVIEAMGRSSAKHLVGMHLTDVPSAKLLTPEEATTAEEGKAVAENAAWMLAEGAYQHEQSTKPQTLAYGLADSPAGLLGWIVEKFRSWSDDFDRYTPDELLTNATIYWATNTIGSSVRIYYEQAHAGPPDKSPIDVPTGVALFPKEIMHPPRSLGERFYDLRRWMEMRHGGHFAAFEEPEALAHEIRTFFRPLRPQARFRLEAGATLGDASWKEAPPVTMGVRDG